jgi:hypothetical protein
VSDATIDNWKAQHPDFLGSSKEGKEEADARVVRSLYQRAIGYSYTTEKIFCDKNGKVTSRCVQKGLPELSRFCQNGDRQYVACLFLWWQQFRRKLLGCASSVSCRARKDVISACRSRRMTTLR